ncbi:hypothetical protein [Rhizobacter sp. OV335]|uniref:hypothetical protein n=1 Tax=Rhizobacter sp. OV335 TaxID=1500264 RepID=UPI0009213296|nr:hypothetical protein [Rhizobacter sp. OV335]SHM70211.1 hypothetical protein SAMN02787076_01956 [Rhizobacter sp. OV335]
MKSLSKSAGACVLAVLLTACGGGGGGDQGDASGATDEAVAVGQSTEPVVEPAGDVAAAPTVEVSSGAEPITEVAESLATDPWVQTWVDAELDAYYTSRPIRVSVSGQGSVVNSVRGTAGSMNCVPGGTSCNAIYTKYKTVLLSAAPKAGQVFRGWGGACSGSGTRDTCEIRNYMLHNVTATFGPA